jgi:hypothetical protein
MSIDRNDVKHGIDVAAEKLKEATDIIAEAARQANAKAYDFMNKAGDTLVEHGEKLKKASTTQAPE